MFERIPEALRARDQWVCHRYPNKAPLCPLPDERGELRFASCSSMATWGSFGAAVKAVTDYGATGIGIQLTGGIVGVDIDHCMDGGEPSELAREIIATLRSYTEISPSETGIHIFCKGKLPDRSRKSPELGLELYDNNRYFTVTGNVYLDEQGAAYPLRDCTDELRNIYGKYFPEEKVEQQTFSRRPNTPDKSEETASPTEKVKEFSDKEILDIAFRKKGGDEFKRLYEGQFAAPKYPSQSEADFALCNHLAFWFNCDTARMDAVFRTSGLYRDKWDRSVGGGKTYGQRTLVRAVRGRRDTFAPTERTKPEPVRPPIPSEPPPTPRESKEKPAPRPAPQESPPQPAPPPIPKKEIIPDATKYTYDDTGNAYRFRDTYWSELRYNHIDKLWLCWTGKRWEEDQTGAVKRRADCILEEMEIEGREKCDDGETNALLKHVRRTRSSKSKESMLKEAQHLDGIPVLPNEFDRYKDAINVGNGVIDLKRGKLRRHDRELMMSMLARVEMRPEATCPLWLKFLDEITRGDTELQLYLQRMVGYCLTGSTVEQCIFFLYGNGKNGKSTFLDTISYMLGDYAKNSQPETVMMKDRGNASARSDVARLKGARLVTTSEPNDGCRLDEGMVKQMTGGDLVTARMLYKAEFDFKPEFKIVMSTNVKPTIRGSDDGIWRRVRLIPFTAQIAPDKVDKHLGDKLRGELSGIFNWAMRGATDWYQHGLSPCIIIDAANEDYRREMDRMQQFVDDCLVKTTGRNVQAKTLYDVYRAWCEQHGERYPMANAKFALELQDHHGYRRQKTASYNVYLDIDFTEMGRQFIARDPVSPR